MLVACVCAAPARAHTLQVGFLELSEAPDGTAMATWRTTVAAPNVTVVFPRTCAAQAGAGGQFSRTTLLRCGGSLRGQTIAVEGLGPVLSEAIVRVGLADGASASAVLRAGRPSFWIPAHAGGLGVVGDFVLPGLRHIMLGADHLLFLLGLVLYTRRPGKALLAASAFTVSHTVTLGLTVLELVQVSAFAAEAAIALSLVFVALSLGRRAPGAVEGAAVAFIFGLVHGLGFAGGLLEMDFPRAAIGHALVGFAAGLELGQFCFIGLLLGVAFVAERAGRLAQLTGAAAYLVGGLGCFWVLDRIVALFERTPS